MTKENDINEALGLAPRDGNTSPMVGMVGLFYTLYVFFLFFISLF